MLKSDSIKTAIIGGTGFNQLDDFEIQNILYPETPYGSISGALVCGHYQGKPLAFLNRHGANQHAQAQRHIPPHQVNYRANIWALKQLGVEDVIALNAVGGIAANLGPAKLAVPDQIIDYTWGRKHSYFDWDDQIDAPVTAQHADFTQPFSPALRSKLLAAAKQAGCAVAEKGTVAATQGPRLESIAEVNRLANDGADLVGMTTMPEAGLARELGLNYACIAVVVNWAAGRPLVGQDNSYGDIHAEIEQWIEQGMGQAKTVIRTLLNA